MTDLQATPAEFVSALDRASLRKTTPLGDGEVVWRIWGQGFPLVLLHGGTGSWMHWMRNIEDLARDYTLIVPDLPGSGESASPPPPITADGIGAALADAVKTLVGADTRFAIAGFSMGGLMAGYLARHSGLRTACLVLVGSTGTKVPRGPMPAPMKSWRRLPTDAEKLAAHRHNLGMLMLHDPNKIDDLAIYMQSVNAERSRVRGKHVSTTGSLAQCLPDLQAPLAGIWGEFDATAYPRLAETRDVVRQFHPHAPFDIVAGAGHWVQYEEPVRFHGLLRKALQSAT